jgi:hypothetical protein
MFFLCSYCIEKFSATIFVLRTVHRHKHSYLLILGIISQPLLSVYTGSWAATPHIVMMIFTVWIIAFVSFEFAQPAAFLCSTVVHEIALSVAADACPYATHHTVQTRVVRLEIRFK